MKAATMTDEISDFVTKFHNLLNAGRKARILIECENGQAYVNLEVKLGSQDCREQHFRRGRGAGPSRLRRRERRKMARLTAAQAAASAMQDAGPPPHHAGGPPLHHGGGTHKGCNQKPEAAHHPTPHTVGEAVHPPPHTAGEAAHHIPPPRAEEVVNFHPSHNIEKDVHLNHLDAEDVDHPHLPPRAVEHAHYQHPHTVAESVPHLLSQRAEQEAAFHHPIPCPVQGGGMSVGRAAEYFPPLSHKTKEVFLPAAAPHQVLPVWPSHYQEDASLILDHRLAPSPLSTSSDAVRTPAAQHYTGQGELQCDAEKKSAKKKKKRKNRSKNFEEELDEWTG